MLKVLILDDEPTSRMLVKDFLSDIATCDDVAMPDEAFDLYKKSQDSGLYDLVILDYNLPGKNGVEFLKELREFENTTSSGRAVPVIVTTAEPAAKRDSFDARCDDFINKPVEREVLLEKLKSMNIL